MTIHATTGDALPQQAHAPASMPRPHPASRLAVPLRIAVLSGGANSERNVSLSSGIAVSQALRALGHAVAHVDSAASPVVPGQAPEEGFLTAEVEVTDVAETPMAPTATAPPDLEALAGVRAQQREGVLADGLIPTLAAADIVFLTVFGDEGESGATQRVLDAHGIAYTGPSPEVCALTFDKVRTKRVLRGYGISTPAWHVVRRAHADEDLARLDIEPPWIVKPVAGGSTIGLSKVEEAGGLAAACARASAEGRDALIERFVEGRDLTVGSLGDQVFAVVEARTQRPLYDYEAKYTPGASDKQVPADLSPEVTAEVRHLAGEIHRLLGIGDTSSRADFRLLADGEVTFFETNPLPGMTPTSSYPLSAGGYGVSFPELCEQIVRRGLANHQRVRPTPYDEA